MDPQFAAEPGERALRVAIVGQQPLATLDQVAQPGGLRPLGPTVEHVAELVLLARVLVVQRVIEVVLFGAGNELLEDFRAIFGQGKRLDKSDRVGGGSSICGRRGKCDKEKADRQAYAFELVPLGVLPAALVFRCFLRFGIEFFSPSMALL